MSAAAPKQPALQSGDVLAGRYRLVRQVSTGNRTTLWQAQDEVLARAVGVRVVPADGARAVEADAFLDAAAAAGAVDLPVFARVFDAALEERPAVRVGADGRTRAAGTLDVAYVIREWVDGRPLDQALRADGPLPAADARALVAQAARGLAVAAERGVGHGRLHPGNLVLTGDGRLKLVDLGVAAALSGAPDTSAARDTRDLGAVLYALLTARWPTTAAAAPAGSLDPAPVRDGAPQRPRQLVKAVPQDLDDLVVRLLAPDGPAAGAPSSPQELARALDRLGEQEVRPATTARLSPRARRRVPVVLVAVLLLALGAASYTVGRSIGAVESEDDAFEALVEPSAPAPAGEGGAPGGPVDLLGTAQVTDFDPPPGDGRESAGAVPNAYDGDPSTAWETERYASSTLGGLKDGVGLLVDLGAPTALAAVELGLRPGTGVEVRAADEAGARIEDFAPVATGGGEEVVRLETRRTARFWLVVLTELPPDGEGFRGGIAEMVLLRG